MPAALKKLRPQLTFQVPAGQRWVVERLGKFSRTLDAGAHRTWPLIESVRSRLHVGPRVREVQLSNAETIDGARPRVALRLELVRFARARILFHIAQAACFLAPVCPSDPLHFFRPSCPRSLPGNRRCRGGHV